MMSEPIPLLPSAPDVFPPFDPQYFAAHIFWLLVSFSCLYFFMSRVALPRVKSILERRRRFVAQTLEHASLMQIKIAEAEAKYEDILNRAREQARAIAQEAHEAVRSYKEEAQSLAEEEFARHLEGAEQKLAQRRVAALAKVPFVSRGVAAQIVLRLTGEAPSADQLSEAADSLKGLTAQEIKM